MSSKPESRKTPQLGSEELIPFDHAAAGHEGVRCTPSGALIAKPCTRQEVEFYESSALHPAFQEFMPLYVGSLSSSEQQQPLLVAAARESGVLPLLDSGDVTADSSLPSQPTSHTSSVQGDSAALAKEEGAWVPSGGKEIDTGLSIVLENIACGFRRPNVLDVKLGARLWADDAPLEKRKKLDVVSKETTSSSLGYRIAGMKVWTGHNGETDEGDRTDPYATKYEGAEGEKGEVIEKDGYRRYDKWYGRSFNKDNVKQGFETFLAGAKAGKIDRSKMVAQRLVKELQDLQLVIESEESRMYSASVLVIYEGDIEAMEHAIEEEQKAPAPRSRGEEEDEDEDDEEFELPEEALELVNVQLGDGMPQQAINISFDPETMQIPEDDEDEEDEIPKVHALRLIDFAHASWTPGQGPDENLLKGVRSLVKVFEELAE
ncbi:Inositol polyphosphate kinase [Penicillium expansum]|uniref:Kinase n=1 Tax=Penicillium expansum TaxID=27334 RepID=A0A0A2JMN9_PENEN|nr:Inositol polyphosphate kinase [Penicillium expansum]KGO35930.1 Inositol polyphosphate kinase [Penicillium expansum]KGO55923.1 Inositol polyphosphate kinase [Penicillium expansum]KGO60606.1 Inositol polyphosphate kinase [Penicillium expansum]